MPHIEEEPYEPSNKWVNQIELKLHISSAKGVREALEFQMRIFDQNYNFD